MNERQKEILDKEFKVNEHFSITRGDYESMPCPLIAWKWNDTQMEKLANAISGELVRYDENDLDGVEDDFWATMENVAVRMGMEYYEDLSDEQIAENERQWNNLK